MMNCGPSPRSAAGLGVRNRLVSSTATSRRIGRRPRREAQRAGDVLTNPSAIEFGPRAGPALGHHGQEPKLLGLRPRDVPFPRDQGVDASRRGQELRIERGQFVDDRTALQRTRAKNRTQ